MDNEKFLLLTVNVWQWAKYIKCIEKCVKHNVCLNYIIHLHYGICLWISNVCLKHIVKYCLLKAITIVFKNTEKSI